MAFFASLRYCDGDAIEGQGEREREDDFTGLAAVALTHFNYAEGEQIAVGFVGAVGVGEGEGLIDAAVGDVEVVDVGCGGVGGYGKDIDVVFVVRDDFCLFAELESELVFLFDLFCFFETQLLGHGEHAILEFFADGSGVAGENLSDFLDVLHVFIMSLFAGTWCFAVVEVVFETRFPLALGDGVGGEVIAAVAQWVEMPYEAEHVVQYACVGEGSIPVGATWAAACGGQLVADFEYSGEVVMRDAYGGVGLVIFEEYVVTRFIAFDEVVLKQEGVFLGGDDDVLYVADLADENLSFACCLCFIEIRTDAATQVLGFAYIDDSPGFIEVLIAAGCFREGGYDGFQISHGQLIVCTPS